MLGGALPRLGIGGCGNHGAFINVSLPTQFDGALAAFLFSHRDQRARPSRLGGGFTLAGGSNVDGPAFTGGVGLITADHGAR